jgi:hypothetical protein
MRCIIRRNSFLLLRILVWTTGLDVKIGLISGVMLGCLLALVLETGRPFSRLPEFLLSFCFCRVVFCFSFFLHES